MTATNCPRCHAPHDGAADTRGWSTCRQCANCWQIAGQSRPAPPPSPALPEVRPSRPHREPEPAAPLTRSDEYSPDDSASGPRTKPLTVRGMHPHGDSAPPLAPIPTDMVQAPSRPPGRTPNRTASSAGDAEAVDSELFERLEGDAQRRRAQQKTVASAANSVIPDPLRGSPAVAAQINQAASEHVSCPVCGHRFRLSTLPSKTFQTCPKCSTSFDTTSGKLAVNAMLETNDPAGADWLIGRTIRGCFIDRKIGEGGMGSVYHARQLSLDRSVALKVMPAELARNKNFIQRFEREAKSLAKINHPNILHIYDFGEDHALGIYFMIIEFVDGKDLGELMRERTTINQLEMLDLVRQALMGLEMASEKGVIHRDIKPDNLMVSDNGICKVSDFGLAKGYGTLDEVTSAGVRVGTPAFMSPEQCDGNDVDYRSDVYSLGCTTFLALTGTLPFSGDSPFSIMLKHKTEPAPSLRINNSDIDPQVDELVQRMLAKAPDDRCTSLRDLILEVEGLLIDLAGTTTVLRRPGDHRPPGDGHGRQARPSSPRIGAGRSPSSASGLRGATHAASPAPEQVPLPEGPSRAKAPDTEATVLPGVLASLPDDEHQGPSRPAASPEAPPAVIDLSAQPAGSPRRSSERMRSVNGLGPPPAEHGGSPATASSTSLLMAQGDAAAAQGASSGALEAYQAALRRRPGNRELQDKVAQVRRQQRHADVDEVEAHGDALAGKGRLNEAVDEWLRASQISSQATRREDLLRKVDATKAKVRRRRLLRRSVSATLFFGLAVINLWLWPPLLHNRAANFRLADILNESDKAGEFNDLKAFIVSQDHPYAWYVRLFPRAAYRVAAVAKAEMIYNHLATGRMQHQVVMGEAVQDQALARLKAAAADPSITWTDLQSQANLLEGSILGATRQAQVRKIAAMAAAAQHQIKADLTAISAAVGSGHGDEALDRTATFRSQRSRYPSSLASDLPLPCHLRITDGGTGKPLSGAMVKVDGVIQVSGFHRICRRSDRPILVEVSLPDYQPQRLTVPPDPALGDQLLDVVLSPRVDWQVSLGSDRTPWFGMVMADASSLLVEGSHVLQGITEATGGLLGGVTRAQIDVPSSGQDPQWTTCEREGQHDWWAGSTDGLAVEFAWDGGLIFQRVLAKNLDGVADYRYRELSLQPGKMVTDLLLWSKGAGRLTSSSLQKELWHEDGFVTTLRPRLFDRFDRLFVLDDVGIHMVEEDGTALGSVSLTSPRTGDAVSLGDGVGEVLAIATRSGVELIRLGDGSSWMIPVGDPDLAKIGPCGLAARGNLLLVTANSGAILLQRLAPAGDLTTVWSTTLPAGRGATGPGEITNSAIAAVDGDGGVELLDPASGALIRRYQTPKPGACAPLLTSSHLLVLDRDGHLTAYHRMPR